MPDLIELYKQYKGKGLEIIGISIDQKGWSAVQPFVKKSGIDYPIVLATPQFAGEYGDINVIPTTYIVDKNGRVIERFIGARDKSAFEAKIKPLLN
ncbi:MAG: TlpA family protein disulfide reductase [Ignavibacteriales bacterium]|nr:TlpA family protein disulfide reductase [Ignavibacteriales bacterium]